MTPSLNQPEASDDSSLGSFQQVHRVEMEDDASENDTSTIPLVNLTMDSSLGMAAKHQQATIPDSWYYLFSLVLVACAAILLGLHSELQATRGELAQLQREHAAFQELTTSKLHKHGGAIGKHAKAHNQVVDILNKDVCQKVERCAHDANSSQAILLQEKRRWASMLGNVSDQLNRFNSTLSELRSELTTCKLRSLGSGSVSAELDPVPQLLMRDIWNADALKAAHALTILLAHARDDPIETKKHFLGIGLANVILVMARWKDTATIQRLGCQILSTLPTALHKPAASFGALDAVLLAMKLYPHDEHLHEQALFTLHHLVAHCSGNMMRIVERLDALPTVLGSMRTFPDSAVAQFYGIRLLKVLGSKHQFVGAIIEAGGIVVLGDVYAQWRGSMDELERGVVELARTTLASLVSKSA